MEEDKRLIPIPDNVISTEIDFVNNILEQAVRHGADLGWII